VLTFLLAGYETTSVAITWTLYHLAMNPDKLAKVQEEVDQELGDRMPTMQDLDRLKFVTMVLKETMRLIPPAGIILREAAEDVVVGDYHFPKGAGVLVSPYAVHHDEQVWDRPEEFHPERFDEEDPNVRSRHPLAWLPFGAGPRNCIGQRFAMMEAKAVLGVLCRRFVLSVDPTHPVAIHPGITLRPRNDIKVQFSKRAH